MHTKMQSPYPLLFCEINCVVHEILNVSENSKYDFFASCENYWERFRKTYFLKGTNPALKKPSNIPEIYAKMFGRFHLSRL